MTTKLSKVSQSRGAASRGLIPFECTSLGSSIVVHCVWDFKQGAKPQLRGLCDANPILFLIHSNKPHSKGISLRKSAVLTPGLGTYCHWERKMLKRQCGEHPWTLSNQTPFTSILLQQQRKKFFFLLPPKCHCKTQTLVNLPFDCCCHLSVHGSCNRKSSRSINKAFRLINLLALAPPSSKHSVCLNADFLPLILQRLSLGWPGW